MKILPLAFCTLGFASAQELAPETQMDTFLNSSFDEGVNANDKENAKKSLAAIRGMAVSI